MIWYVFILLSVLYTALATITVITLCKDTGKHFYTPRHNRNGLSK